MGITEYEIIIKDVDGKELYNKRVKYSSLLAYLKLGYQLYNLRKNKQYPTFCSIEKHQLG